MDRPTGRTFSASSARRGVGGLKKPDITSAVGAVDEDFFVQSFDQVPNITIFSPKDLSDHVSKIKDVLNGSVEEWEKRIDSLRTIRSLVIAGAIQYDDFLTHLRNLELPMQTCVTDLRSQVVREACITLSFLAQELKNRFDHFAESMLPHLVNTSNSSVKIMSSSGIVCIRFIIQYTHSPRLIPIITSNLTSKSNTTRRYSCEILESICRDWPTHALEKHVGLLQEAIKKGIADADQDARSFARSAFSEFANHFRDQAEAMLQTMDPSKRKMIQKDTGLGDLGNHPPPPQRQLSASSATGGGEKRIRSAITSTGASRREPGEMRPPQARSRIATANQVPRQDGSNRVGGKRMVSQSQPTSREVSPTRTGGLSNDVRRGVVRSRIPRSQGTSRETSPNRAGGNHATTGPGSASHSSAFARRQVGRSSGRIKNILGQPVLSQDPDAESALATALSRGRRRHESSFDSDDNASETSSICSDTSYRGAPGFVRQADTVQDILVMLSSAQWTERKDGLLNLQNYMRNSRHSLNQSELRKLTEIFTKIFQDPQSKVAAVFMDTLQSFVKEYNPYLHDWLYTLLTRLLTKQGNESLPSQQKRIAETLFVIRSHFPLDLQFQLCCKYVTDNSQTPTFKVKACLLEYMKDLLLLTSPDFVNEPTQDLKMAISRIITWTYETKSADVRKNASRLIVKLFDLNMSGFTNIMQSLPRSFQESAYKVINTYMEASDDVRLPGDSTGDNRHRRSSGAGVGTRSGWDANEESISPEDINTYLKKTTEDIQSLSCNYDSVGTSSTTSGGSTLHGSSTTGSSSSRLPVGQAGRRPSRGGDSGIQNSDIEDKGKQQLQQHHTNAAYSAPMNNYDLNNDEMPPDDIMVEILQELSNHNDRHQERRTCMENLINMLKDRTIMTWDEHFKTTLLLLLETLGDDEGETRAVALKVLQELLRGQPERFHEYTHLTIVKILEAHKDTDKSVIRAAEECALVLAATLPQELCLRVLIPIVLDSDYQITLAALKMESQVIKDTDPNLIDHMMNDLSKGLVLGCNNKESHIRKASIFCLVEIFQKIGDNMWPYLKELNNSKIRLLNLYITRTKENTDNGGGSSGRSNLTSPNPS